MIMVCRVLTIFICTLVIIQTYIRAVFNLICVHQRVQMKKCSKLAGGFKAKRHKTNENKTRARCSPFSAVIITSKKMLGQNLVIGHAFFACICSHLFIHDYCTPFFCTSYVIVSNFKFQE